MRDISEEVVVSASGEVTRRVKVVDGTAGELEEWTRQHTEELVISTSVVYRVDKKETNAETTGN